MRMKTRWHLVLGTAALALCSACQRSAFPEGAQPQPLPAKRGQVFVVDDFNNKIMQADLGFNYCGGNAGLAQSAEGIGRLALVNESRGAPGGSLDFAFDFTRQPSEGPFVGAFFSLFGLTDTKVSLDGNPGEPARSTPFPGYFLDCHDMFRGFQPWRGRRLDELRFDVRLKSANPITLRIELKDEKESVVFTRHEVSSQAWQTVSVALPSGFTQGDVGWFDWRQVSLLSLVVERRHVGDGVANPTVGELLVDNLALVDHNGLYPDLDAARGRPEFTKSFLEYVRSTSFLYFLDFACTDPRCGGIIQDRSRFADLMSVGGVGFQLTAYVIGARRGYISRRDSAARTRSVLRLLVDKDAQHPGPVGATGYRGFFYHFLGIDGRRKQNFDFTATSDVDESLNTVELSVIDTALAVCGVLTAQAFFGQADEQDIRDMADEVYRRVDWPFMLDKHSNQFFLGWKPKERRDDRTGRYGRFLLDDAEGLGQYSSRPENDREVPATIDYYTDEGLLIALLAMSSPNVKHQLDPSVFFSAARHGAPFVKTFPGSLFTYQFAACWLDTRALGSDHDPSGRAASINYFENTRQAIQACREYCRGNPNGRKSLSATRFGLSACDGPFNDYFAEAAPCLALATEGGICDRKGNRFSRPLEAGTVTVYATGSSIVHEPDAAVAGLWECQRLGLLHPRFGLADAFSLDVADAFPASLDAKDPRILRRAGPWANFCGFAIDHGPTLILIDNYLNDNFVPRLFMSHPGIAAALRALFPEGRLPAGAATRAGL